MPSLCCSQVVCVHPGWEAIGGKPAIVESWARIFANQPGFIVSAIGARAFVMSTGAAFVLCTERMPGGEAVATNVFCLENGKWCIVHHHGGPGRGLKSTEDDAEKVGLELRSNDASAHTQAAFHAANESDHWSAQMARSRCLVVLQIGLGLESLSATIRKKREKGGGDDDDVVSAPNQTASTYFAEAPRL